MAVRMSLADAGRILGIAPNSVRSRWKAGKLRGERDNSGKIWVWLDADAEPVPPTASKVSNREPKASTVPSGEVTALRAHVETLNRQIEAARADLDAARQELVQEREERRKLTDALLERNARSEPHRWWPFGR